MVNKPLLPRKHRGLRADFPLNPRRPLAPRFLTLSLLPSLTLSCLFCPFAAFPPSYSIFRLLPFRPFHSPLPAPVYLHRNPQSSPLLLPRPFPFFYSPSRASPSVLSRSAEMSSLLLGLLLLPPRRNHAIRPDGLLLATLAPPESYLDPLEFRTLARDLFQRNKSTRIHMAYIIAFIYIIARYLLAPSHSLLSVTLIKR